MIVGVPKEIKNHEYRVGITPSGVGEFVKSGHKLLVEKGAGLGSGFTDDEYTSAGATIIDVHKDVYAESEMIYKIKEPLPEEYNLLKENQIVFTYFHFAADEKLTRACMDRRIIAIAYETIILDDGSLPLLRPMSEIAGRMSAIMGAYYLGKPLGGKGVLMCGIPGVAPAEFIVLGGGTVGMNAARIAAGMGASVTVLEIIEARMRYLEDVLPPNVKVLKFNDSNLLESLKRADVVIGAVLVPGAKAPKIIKRDMLKLMKKGAVIVDVSVDQGGIAETTKPTSHSNPVFEVDGVVHYCVANMPGAYPRTSTLGITNATLPYALAITNKGYKEALRQDKSLMKGLNMISGKVTNKGVADAFGLKYWPPEQVL